MIAFSRKGFLLLVLSILSAAGADTDAVPNQPPPRPQLSYCVSAIVKPSPFGKWTDNMIAVLGTEQEMTFVFCYK
jgi:hypothetical protein